MNKIKNFFILFGMIINAQLIQGNEDLIELNCTDDAQCKQFETSGIISSCLQEQCRCASSDGKIVNCQPVNPIVSNIIGGSCPCKIPNADCDEKENICYCISEFVPSRDKRRCIRKSVELDAKCEDTSQCEKADFNAICNESMECKCMDQFVNDRGACVSVLGTKSPSLKNETQCLKAFGANARYNSKTQKCICKRGYFASVDNSKCLKVAKYLENCTENLQCAGTMGPGGVCVENACQCAEKHFVEERKHNASAFTTVCTPTVKRGQYCRYDEDCYQRQLSESEQSMHCTYGECNCRNGFNSFNEGACVPGTGAAIKAFVYLQTISILYSATLIF